jgi:hypothetical protein
MMPRIEASEALHAVHLATINNPYCEPGYRSGTMAHWRAAATGIPTDVDEQGRTLLHSAADLRAWLRVQGNYQAEVQA